MADDRHHLEPHYRSGGVAALYKRSLYLTVSTHPWLGGAQQGAQAGVNITVLKSLLAQQSSADAAAAGGALLQTFYELLASLVGPSLTERLLRAVWTNPFSGAPAQDTSP